MGERYIRTRFRRWRSAALALLTGIAAGCGTSDGSEAGGDEADPEAPAAVASVPAGERPVLLVVGTSLTAGLGVDPSEAYPARLEELAESAGLPFRVVNAGVSGETSAGALARMDWLLRQEPDVVVIETGANDGLRGLDPAALERNLVEIVQRTRAARPDAEIAIVQMEAPPNLGRSYTSRFREVYADVAREHGATLLPFPLADVAGIDSLNQLDGIHPTPSGHRRMAATLWPALEPVLREALTARPAGRR